MLFRSDFASTASSQFLIRASGGVGIGTNSPSQQLDVNGSIALSGTHLVYNSAAGVIDWGPGNSLFFRTLSTQGNIDIFTERMAIAADGKVGIGQSIPLHPLHMGSGAFCSAAGVWTNASSRNYKTDIQPLKNSEYSQILEKLGQVDVVRFKYKKDPNREHIGLASFSLTPRYWVSAAS